MVSVLPGREPSENNLSIFCQYLLTIYYLIASFTYIKHLSTDLRPIQLGCVVFRYVFEGVTLIGCLMFMFFQLGGEIKVFLT